MNSILSNLKILAAGLVLAPVATFVDISNSALAETFSLPSGQDNVIGHLQYVKSREEETLVDVAREYDLGYDQIVRGNPGVNRWIPGKGNKVLLPHLYVLPSGPRQGLVMNLAELRIYYYPPAAKGQEGLAMTFPVSIGRMDWRTPLGPTTVIRKDKNPAWYPPESIRAEHARDGDPLPKMVPGGTPDNPLGGYALRLGFPGYLIHGVDERKAYGIGMRVTHGCIRMYPEDIERLYALVPVKTPVVLVDQPVKVGWKGANLYLEVHQPFEEGESEEAPTQSPIHPDDVVMYVKERVGMDVIFDENKVIEVAERGDGIPTIVGKREIERPVISGDSYGLKSERVDPSISLREPAPVPPRRAGTYGDDRDLLDDDDSTPRREIRSAPPEQTSVRSYNSDSRREDLEYEDPPIRSQSSNSDRGYDNRGTVSRSTGDDYSQREPPPRRRPDRY